MTAITVLPWAPPAITFLQNGQTETELTYSELNQDINQFANTLADLGVKKGDRVILFLQKSLAAVTAHFALQKTGGIAVPLNPGFKRNELEICPVSDEIAVHLRIQT